MRLQGTPLGQSNKRAEVCVAARGRAPGRRGGSCPSGGDRLVHVGHAGTVQGEVTERRPRTG